MTTVALAATPPIPSSADGQYVSNEIGYSILLVSAQTLTTATTITTPTFTIPYMTATGKVKMVLEVSAISGASAGIAVSYFETVDGTNFNSTAALAIASQTATGAYWSAVATGPVFNQGQLSFTTAGTPNVTFSVYLVVWNK